MPAVGILTILVDFPHYLQKEKRYMKNFSSLMESKEALFHTFLYDTVSPMLGKMWVPLDFSKLGVTHPIVIFPKSPKPHMYLGKKSSKFNVMQLVHM